MQLLINLHGNWENTTMLKNCQRCDSSEISPWELPYFRLIPCHNYFLHLLSQNKSHQNQKINFRNKNWILWFLKQLNEHSLGPLMLVLDRTWHLKLVLTWGNNRNGTMYDVESSFSEYVVSHLAWILSCVLGIEDARFLCLCLGPAAGAALSVTVRYMEAARRKQIGTVEARCRLVIGEL